MAIGFGIVENSVAFAIAVLVEKEAELQWIEERLSCEEV